MLGIKIKQHKVRRPTPSYRMQMLMAWYQNGQGIGDFGFIKSVVFRCLLFFNENLSRFPCMAIRILNSSGTFYMLLQRF
jgi:hypothetical protein